MWYIDPERWESSHPSSVDLEASIEQDCQGCSSMHMKTGGCEFQEKVWLFILFFCSIYGCSKTPDSELTLILLLYSIAGSLFSFDEWISERDDLKKKTKILKTDQKMILSLIYQRHLKNCCTVGELNTCLECLDY